MITHHYGRLIKLVEKINNVQEESKPTASNNGHGLS